MKAFPFNIGYRMIFLESEKFDLLNQMIRPSKNTYFTIFEKRSDIAPKGIVNKS